MISLFINIATIAVNFFLTTRNLRIGHYFSQDEKRYHDLITSKFGGIVTYIKDASYYSAKKNKDLSPQEFANKLEKEYEVVLWESLVYFRCFSEELYQKAAKNLELFTDDLLVMALNSDEKTDFVYHSLLEVKKNSELADSFRPKPADRWFLTLKKKEQR